MKKEKHNQMHSLSISSGEKITKTDRIIILILTLAYALIALPNLGTLSFPVSVYTAQNNEVINFEFNEPVTVREAWVNANIGSGSIVFYSEDGEETEWDGEMFQWDTISLDFSNVTCLFAHCEEGTSINELAFFNENDELLPYTVTSETGAEVGDEQNTVPDYPSYLNGMYFDEIYHARTAYEYMHGMPIYEWTHPPLGKLIIGIGILIFGMKPFGWRIMGTIFGIAMVPVLYIFGKRLFKRSDYALLSAGLLSFDCMHYTQTRIATIDVYGVFFIILMFFFMYEFLLQPYCSSIIRYQLKPLLFCGIAFSAGCSSKWIGCYAGAGLAVLLFWRIIDEYFAVKNNNQLKKIFIRKTVSILLHCCAFFLLIPAIIYYLSYIPYYVVDASYSETYGFKDSIKTLINNQKDMFNYHSTLTATHMCQSTWYQWPFTSKSVWFYVSAVEDKISNISSTGNPAVWWISTIGTIGLIVERILKKVPRSHALRLLLVGIAANLGPWILVTRCVFLYHFFATVPFIILCAVSLLYNLEQQNPSLSKVKWIWLALSCVYFILLFPAISGLPISHTYASFLENTLPSTYLFYGWA